VIGTRCQRKWRPRLHSDNRGIQPIYLTELPHPLALQLAELLVHEIAALARAELVREPDLAKAAPQRVFEVGRFTSEQGCFLEYHRDEVFLSARIRNAG
jgi:hypothetical protein